MSVRSKRPVLYVTVSVATLLLFFQNCSSSKMNFNVDPASQAFAVPVCRDMTAVEVVPKLKFAWDYTKSFASDFNQVMSTPVVGDLDGDDVPEIVFTTFKGKFYTASGYVRVISGADGREVWSATKPEHMAYGTIAPLLIDIEGDGKVEVIYLNKAASGTNMIALNYDGSERWVIHKATSATVTDDSLSATDLDRDGIADIVAPGFVVTERYKKPYLKNHLELLAGYNIPVNLQAAQSGFVSKMNIVNAMGIMDSNGKTIVKFSKTGFPAIADIYPEQAGAEVVLVGGGTFQVYSAQGKILVDKVLTEHTANTCGGTIGGGQATIGDFDGDEKSLEIAVATGRSLTIYDVQGNKIAGSLTRDCSSRKTGVASFDFNGDKKPEIVYGDEQYLRIYELDGSLNLRIIWETANPSGTLSEYPVVADADGDGYADLVVAQNSYSYDAQPESLFYKMNGVRVFGPTVQGSWMPTRPVWNQHNYFITNVTDTLRPTATTFTMGQLPKSFKRNTFQDIPEMKCQ